VGCRASKLALLPEASSAFLDSPSFLVVDPSLCGIARVSYHLNPCHSLPWRPRPRLHFLKSLQQASSALQTSHTEPPADFPVLVWHAKHSRTRGMDLIIVLTAECATARSRRLSLRSRQQTFERCCSSQCIPSVGFAKQWFKGRAKLCKAIVSWIASAGLPAAVVRPFHMDGYSLSIPCRYWRL
jgi:hypothetical protein